MKSKAKRGERIYMSIFVFIFFRARIATSARKEGGGGGGGGEGGTDVLIRLHASLEVGTRDDLCGPIFA